MSSSSLNPYRTLKIMHCNQQIDRLRQEMLREGLDAWLVTSSDPHQSEYVCAHWQIRAWLSGFKGSAGTLVVTQEQAVLWTDPRYHIRARQELEGSGIHLFKSGIPGVPTIKEWLGDVLPEDGTLGFDGKAVSVKTCRELLSECEHKNIHLRTNLDLPDRIWHDRPKLMGNQIVEHPEAIAGESRTGKLERTRKALQQAGADLTILSTLDDIAWLFNIRGTDIPCNPVAFAFAAVSMTEARLFVDAGKLDSGLARSLADCGIQFHPYDGIYRFAKDIDSRLTILMDPERTGWELLSCIPEHCKVIESTSIPVLLKATKNEIQINGIRNAHLVDGLAVTRWLFWMDNRDPSRVETEISLAEKLESFRAEFSGYKGKSFDTICAYGSNSAVGHYAADPVTTPEIRQQGLLLLDSGGQYLDGTTDITRTICLDAPSREQREAFAAVLTSLVRLSSIRFPKGTTGMLLDAIAREPLWRSGWNCRHGIGHGVGHYLNVHEGPQRIAPENTVAIQEGMVLSCEPGVYFEGNFGIRLENLLVAKAAPDTAFGEFLEFETVTFCPIDLKLVDSSLLSTTVMDWLNAYHHEVFRKLSPFLTPEETEWLRLKTRHLPCNVSG